MTKNAAEEYFIEGLLLTRNARGATQYMATRLSAELGRALPSIHGRPNMLSYAEKVGIRIDVIDVMIPDIELSPSDVSRICTLVIDEPGTVIDIPDSKCIQRNLPPDRAPSLEEIQKAIATCRNR